MKRKLKRINIYPDRYTTGDAQDWTHEYTWEDFQASRKYITVKPGSQLHKCMVDIEDYFIKHPEKLLEGGYFKDKGCSPETIRDILLGNITFVYT